MQRKRVFLLLAAAIVVVALILYPSTQCRVAGSDVAVSPPKAFAVSVLQGYAVGLTFNVTNRSNCEINSQSLRVVLQGLVYSDGRQVAQDTEDTEQVGGTLAAGQTRAFSHTFEPYFNYKPVKLLLKIEMTFAETGPLTVFDGEVSVPG